MLGREAGYTGREVTWDALLKQKQDWQLGFDLKQFS
jgi:hypothetical protein